MNSITAFITARVLVFASLSENRLQESSLQASVGVCALPTPCGLGCTIPTKLHGVGGREENRFTGDSLYLYRIGKARGY